MAVQEPVRTKGFLCKHCGIVCSNMPSLLEHMDTHLESEEDRKFKCDECGRGYRHAGSLANHKKTHEVGSFQCPICARQLSNSLALKNHLRIHTSRKKYPCMDCGKAFRLATQLATHQRVHRNREARGSSSRRGSAQASSHEDQDELHYKDEQGFDDVPNLEPDMGLNLPVEDSFSDGGVPDILPGSASSDKATPPEDAGDRPYKCNMCDKTYRHYGSLNNHKKSHQVGTFECTICFKQFNNLAALSSHQRIHSKTRGRSSTGATPPAAALSAAAATATHPERKPEQGAGPQHNGSSAAAASVHFCHLCQMAFPNDDEFQDHILLHNSSSVSFELPVNMPDDGGFAYSASQSPEYPPSSDTPPMPPLLDKQEDYGQPVGSAENGQIFIPDPFQDGPPMLNSQGDPDRAAADLQGDVQASESANHQVKEEEEESPGSDRRFKCNVCNKSYRHAGSLINHKRSHQTGVYQCSICRKNYPHLAALRSHHRIHRAQTSSLTHGAEGDWLSSEPQTQGGYPLSEEDEEEEDIGDVLDLPEDLQDEPHLLPEHQGADHHLHNPHPHPHHHPHHHQGHPDEAMGYHEQYDMPYAQEDGAAHLPHGGEPLLERHMCADCGKTFGDIAAIKSHACPIHLQHQQQQQQHHQQHSALTNGSGSHVDYQGQHLIGESGIPIGFEGHGSGQGYYPEHLSHPHHHGYHPHMHGGMIGSDGSHGYEGDMEERAGNDDDDDEYDGGGEEEEDGEMYHCSVCGNHYTSMRALRNHLRSHTQLHGTPSSSGPSSMSSLEAEKEEDGGGGENQPGDGSLIICSTCGESFTRKQDLVAHQLLHSQAAEPPPPPPQLLPPPPPLVPQHYGANPENPLAPKQEPASIICSKCGISCVSFQHLENHPCPGRQEGDAVKSEDKLDGEPSLGRSEAGRPEESQESGDRLFKCDQCGRAYRHAGSLLNHKKSHKTGVFRCYVCQKRFYNLLALKSHERTHFDIKKHTCTECGKAFKIHKQLQNHLRVHEENKAKIQELNKQIQTLMQMNGELAQNGLRLRKAQRHKRREAASSSNGGEGGGGGPSPEKDALGTSSAVQSPPPGPHDPNDPRPYVCNQCGRSYRHAGSLVNHKNSHKTGEYHCSICNNTYSNQLAMKNHLRIHFGLKKHGCQACGKAFRGKKQLLNHRCAANRKSADGPTRGRGRRRPREPTCKRCRQTFASLEELGAHACAAPSNSAGGGGDGQAGVSGGGGASREERPYKCGICGRSYRHAGSLLNHKNTHKTGHFSCAFCGKPFSNPMALRNHTRIHTQKKKHVCPTCGKAFRLSSILHNHLKIHARGVSTFGCPTCGKTFQGRSGLKRHRCTSGGSSGSGGGGGGGGGRDSRRSASGHEGGDKCYTCDQCGRSYRHAGSLLNHKKTHSSDLLHCSLCLRTFTDPLALESHAQMPRHCCPDCGKTFCEFAHMQSHMEVHSKGRPLPGGGGGASGSGYLHHPHSHHQQQQQLHPHHQQLHPGQAQQGYPHSDGLPMEDELDWNSGMDPRMGLQGGLPKIGQAFGQVHSGGSGGGGGMSSGSTSGGGGFPGDLQEHGGEDGGETAEKSHVCEHCGRAYRHAGSLLNHKNSHKMGSFFCSVCQKEFTNLMALKNHRRIHTEPKRYQCLECGKAFRVSTQLICHRRIHTKEKPFSCLLCDKRFSSKSNLRHHQKMHQNSQASYEASFDMDPSSFMGLGVDPFL